jgi:predicted nucleic acid-binding protein
MALAEISGALARVTGDSNAGLAANRMIQNLGFVRLVPVDAGLARLGAATASTLKLRGCDAIYVALAQRLGVPLITWDREQRERGGMVIQAMTPEQALEI